VTRRQTVALLPGVGGLTPRDTTLFVICFLAPVLMGVIWGVAEPAFFTWIAVQYNASLNAAVILGHWSILCVLMGASFLVTGLLPALLSLVQNGWTPRTRLFVIAGILGALAAILAEDLVAHLRYGALSREDWTHWILPSFLAVRANFWIPTWYLLVALLIVVVFYWYAWHAVTPRGGAHDG
jgi:predicted permease